MVKDQGAEFKMFHTTELILTAFVSVSAYEAARKVICKGTRRDSKSENTMSA